MVIRTSTIRPDLPLNNKWYYYFVCINSMERREKKNCLPLYVCVCINTNKGKSVCMWERVCVCVRACKWKCTCLPAQEKKKLCICVLLLLRKRERHRLKKGENVHSTILWQKIYWNCKKTIHKLNSFHCTLILILVHIFVCLFLAFPLSQSMGKAFFFICACPLLKLKPAVHFYIFQCLVIHNYSTKIF